MKLIKSILFFGFILVTLESACNSKDTSSKNDINSNAPDGASIFRKNCVLCHGIDGKLALNGAKDLTKSVIGEPERIEQITNGKGLMTPFNGVLSAKEIKAVAKYSMTLNPSLK